jgi:hypothetical protein
MVQFYNIAPRGLYHKTFYGRNTFLKCSKIVSLFNPAKSETGENTLAFYITELITTIKVLWSSFQVLMLVNSAYLFSEKCVKVYFTE